MSEEGIEVPFDEFNAKYAKRDREARAKMKELIESDQNTVTHVFSDLLKEDE